jgi:AAA domain
MNHLATLSPGCRTALYTAQTLPLYRDNPLIEALPPCLSDAVLLASVSWKPEITESDRARPTQERFSLMLQLRGFLVPLEGHLEACRLIDSYLRGGYVGRNPRTGEQFRIAQQLYEDQKAGKAFARTSASQTPQLSASLLGTPGTGKTSLIKAFCEQFPDVIYHPEHHLYQVPVLFIEMPADGTSIRGIAHAILTRLDEIIPGANYFETYALKGKPSADILAHHIARLMNIHCVGILIIDEIQNLDTSNKTDQKVMTELVSACNKLKVPLLFVGTKKGSRILSLDFRQVRRSSGYPLANWERLREHVENNLFNEWRDFISILWNLQWTRHRVELDECLLSLMYRYSQGIIGIAITLFVGAQAQVMLDGTERLTADAITAVYEKKLVLIHKAIEALHSGVSEALIDFEDFDSADLTNVIESFERQGRTQASPLRAVTSLEPEFESQIVSALVETGVSVEDAVAAAAAAKARPRTINLATGMKLALDFLTPPSPVPQSKSKKGKTATELALTDRPKDYRNAVIQADNNRTTVIDELASLGMAPRLEDLVDLS